MDWGSELRRHGKEIGFLNSPISEKRIKNCNSKKIIAQLKFVCLGMTYML